jgi:protoporphyrinogen oxidase
MKSFYDRIVLGAGLAGLTFATETDPNQSILVLEKLSVSGGLSRTVRLGEFWFDLGGHRFHSQWPEILTYVEDLLGDSKIVVDRQSRIYINQRYVQYPLEFPNALLALGLGDILKVAFSSLYHQITRGSSSQRSFEDWIVSRYGRTLFEIYFRPYTEKVLGRSCTEISADWAEQRVKLPNLLSAVMKSLLPPKDQNPSLISKFIYPEKGIGQICDFLEARLIQRESAQVLKGRRITNLHWEEENQCWRVEAAHDGVRQEFRGRELISTIPWHDLAVLMGDEDLQVLAQRFDYRDLICVFLGLDQARISKDTWTYFPDPDLIFGRMHEPGNWSRDAVPDGKTSLVLELFCSRGDAIWEQDDSALIQQTISDLEGLGLIAPEAVCKTHLVRVENAYPIYHINYQEDRKAFIQACETIPNLTLLGRTGNFDYINMDATIKEALDLARSLPQR